MVLSSFMYAAISIIFLSALIVYIYMCKTNEKYRDICSVYGVSSRCMSTTIIAGGVVYLFITGACVDKLSAIWTNAIFLACLGGSVFMAGIICKILKIIAREKFRYAETFRADERVIQKMEVVRKEIERLNNEVILADTPEDRMVISNSIKDARTMLSDLKKIHSELQRQKYLLNADMSIQSLDAVSLKRSKDVKADIAFNKDRLLSSRELGEGLAGIESLMTKYRI